VTGERSARILGHMGDDTAQMLKIRPWWDPQLAVGGHPPRSLYFETYWLPVLGPAATLALRDLTRRLG